ncbi:MAG: hypothetical protein ABIT38_12305, partial [Gemmatimonadaceae bacterium]
MSLIQNHRSALFGALIISLFSASPGAGLAQATAPAARARGNGEQKASAVRYEIAFPNAAHHEAEVTATFGA